MSDGSYYRKTAVKPCIFKTVMNMSYQEYNTFLKKHKVITNTKESQLVKRVGERIESAVERYFLKTICRTA